jgi:tetratricopeptide (TPR) repeat protein
MKRPRVPFLDILESAKNLLENQSPKLALRLLKTAIINIYTHSDWKRIRDFVQAHAEDFIQLHKLEWLEVYCHTLTGTREKDLLLEITTDLQVADKTAMLLLHRSWGLLEAEQFSQANDLLSQAIPHLHGSALGVAKKRQALAAFHLNLEWQTGFAEATALLSGRLLGLALIDWAGCSVRSGQLELARELLTQALPKLRGDHYHLAWARYNLGEIAVQLQDGDAERHYREAETLSRARDARPLHSRALQGLGRWRRHQGDLLRALDAYRRATHEQSEVADQRAAHWSFGRTLRLAGRSREALEQLEVARQLGSKPGIELESAACWLALGEPPRAIKHLEKTHHEPYKSVGLMLEAECARLEKRGVVALELLSQVNFNSLNAREELGFWHDLCQLGKLGGMDLPNVPQPSQHCVDVLACGVLQVRVNGTPVRLNPTGRVGELLVLLLELGGAAHVETVIEKFYTDERIPKRKKSAVWDLVKRLRQSLGWDESVLAVGNTLRLAPNVQWIYDAVAAREQRQAVGFLEGVRSNWALEVGQELAALGGRTGWEHGLN